MFARQNYFSEFEQANSREFHFMFPELATRMVNIIVLHISVHKISNILRTQMKFHISYTENEIFSKNAGILLNTMN